MTTSPAVPVPVPEPNLVTNRTDKAHGSQKRKKKKKFLKQSESIDKDQSIQNWSTNDDKITEWKSDQQQQVYRSKLFKALRQLRQSSGAVGTGTTVRETADRVLAATAKGRTRWSRAILTNKLKLRFMMSNRRQRGLVVTSTGNSRLKRPKLRILKLKRKKLVVVKTNNLPAVQRKARVLGGLVPGCHKQPLPVVLKEATDYIPALEMQVKAMAALVELLSGGSGSGSSTDAGTGTSNLGRLSLNRTGPCL